MIFTIKIAKRRSTTEIAAAADPRTDDENVGVRGSHVRRELRWGGKAVLRWH